MTKLRDRLPSIALAVAATVLSAAAVAPASTRGRVLSWVRLDTVTGKPARSRLRAMPEPMRPSPMTATGGLAGRTADAGARVSRTSSPNQLATAESPTMLSDPLASAAGMASEEAFRSTP